MLRCMFLIHNLSTFAKHFRIHNELMLGARGTERESEYANGKLLDPEAPGVMCESPSDLLL